MKQADILELTNIPSQLRDWDQWVCWKYQADQPGGRDRTRKVPIDPRTHRFAKATDQSTWTAFDEAITVYERSHEDLAGIGFVFTDNDPFVGIDLDDCRETVTGKLDPWAEEVIDRLGTYTEVSPSGTGVKAIVTTGSEFRSRRRSNPGIEVYSSARFFTITGQSIDGNLETCDGTDDLSWIQQTYFPEPAPQVIRTAPASVNPCVSDNAVIHKATNAKNGWKFLELWNGNTAKHGGNQSQADMSLCRLLAFWCGPCPEQIDRLFRQSGLLRSKWDERHYSNGSTYGMETIKRAISAQGSTCYRWTS